MVAPCCTHENTQKNAPIQEDVMLHHRVTLLPGGLAGGDTGYSFAGGCWWSSLRLIWPQWKLTQHIQASSGLDVWHFEGHGIYISGSPYVWHENHGWRNGKTTGYGDLLARQTNQTSYLRKVLLLKTLHLCCTNVKAKFLMAKSFLWFLKPLSNHNVYWSNHVCLCCFLSLVYWWHHH